MPTDQLGVGLGPGPDIAAPGQLANAAATPTVPETTDRLGCGHCVLRSSACSESR